MVETRSVCQKAGQTGKYVLGQSVQKAFSLRLRKGKKKRFAHVEAFSIRLGKGWTREAHVSAGLIRGHTEATRHEASRMKALTTCDQKATVNA